MLWVYYIPVYPHAYGGPLQDASHSRRNRAYPDGDEARLRPLPAMTLSSCRFQAGFHTLTTKIFLQQISDFPIHRGSEMFLAIKEVDHLAW